MQLCEYFLVEKTLFKRRITCAWFPQGFDSGGEQVIFLTNTGKISCIYSMLVGHCGITEKTGCQLPWVFLQLQMQPSILATADVEFSFILFYSCFIARTLTLQKSTVKLQFFSQNAATLAYILILLHFPFPLGLKEGFKL